MEADVSAIIVNWNGEEWLSTCLSSLREQTLSLREIIVVDNGSTDGSAVIGTIFGVRWLQLPTNQGLALALNKGAQIARGNVLLFLNNDMRFDGRFVESLFNVLDRQADVFACDALQYDWNGHRVVHWACLLESMSRGDITHGPFHGAWINQYSTESVKEVALTSAAAMMVRRDLFDELGGFDDRLPMGYEDLDLSLRAWARGWRSVFVPSAICWHHVGASTTREGSNGFGFQGTILGKLITSLKFASSSDVFWTWLTISMGLVKDLFRGHFGEAGILGRLSALGRGASYIKPLLGDRIGLQAKIKSQATLHNTVLEYFALGE